MRFKTEGYKTVSFKTVKRCKTVRGPNRNITKRYSYKTYQKGTLQYYTFMIMCRYKTAHYHKSIVLWIGWTLNLPYANPGCGQTQPTEHCEIVFSYVFHLFMGGIKNGRKTAWRMREE